jgi:hypothetical protein
MATPLSPAGQQLFGDMPGLGSMLGQQTADQAEELRRRRQLMSGGAFTDLAAAGYGNRAALASPAGSVLAGFGGRLR